MIEVLCDDCCELVLWNQTEFTEWSLSFQLPAVVQKLRERKWKVGELLHMLLRYYDESQSEAREESLEAGTEPHYVPLFQWLLEHA